MQVPSQATDPEAASSCHAVKASEFRQGDASSPVPRRAPPNSRLCKDVRDVNGGRSSPLQRSPRMSPQRSASAPTLVGGTAAEPSTPVDGSARKAVEHGRTAQPEASRRSLFPPSGPPSASKWGSGISPGRCPGLGTPMRKAHIAGGGEGIGGKMTEDSGGRLSTSCQLSSAAVRPCATSTDAPLRSPSACGSTSTALGLHQCGVGGTRCRRRPGTVSLGAPSSRCSRVTAGSAAPQPTPCIADLVDLWEGKQRESEIDEVLMPEVMAAGAREKRTPLALLTASPQRRTRRLQGCSEHDSRASLRLQRQ